MFRTPLFNSYISNESTLYAKGKTLSCIPSKIIQELHKMLKQLRINRLSLSMSDSSYTLALYELHSSSFASNCHSRYTYFLGTLVDPKLKFRSHIKNVCAKVSRAFGIFYKLVIIQPFHILRKLFFTQIYPFVT